MGIVNSIKKIKNDSEKKKRNNEDKLRSAISKQVDEYEDVELIHLRMAIANDPNSFILNNLMMCMQFFENYEE